MSNQQVAKSALVAIVHTKLADVYGFDDEFS